MEAIVGTVLLVLGVVFCIAGALDFAKHGGFYMRARPEGYVAGTGQTVFFAVLFTAMILGGFYLVMPNAACGLATFP